MNYILQKELLKRGQVDQAMRTTTSSDMTRWDNSVDETNTLWLENVLQDSGWPTISMVGEEAARAAWLLVQHADHNSDFQLQCLKILQSLPANEVLPANIAFLEDRVLVANGQPQLYGTQFHYMNNQYVPLPINDAVHLAARRAAMGLEPFDEYQQMMRLLY